MGQEKITIIVEDHVGWNEIWVDPPPKSKAAAVDSKWNRKLIERVIRGFSSAAETSQP